MKPLFILMLLIQHLTIGLSVVNADETFSNVTYLGTNQRKLLNAEVASEYGFRVASFNLDDLENLEAEITKGLPDDPVEAERLANERMGDFDRTRAMKLFQGVVYLMQWDIKKLPAFVFEDGKYVIYGVTDTSVAINRYANSRKR